MATDTLTKPNPEESRAQRMAEALAAYRNTQPSKAAPAEPVNTQAVETAKDSPPATRSMNSDGDSSRGISEARAGVDSTPAITASQEILGNLKGAKALDLVQQTSSAADLRGTSIAAKVEAANLTPDPTSTPPSASTATAAAEATTPQNLQVTATRGRKLALEILEASLKDGKINEATKNEQTLYLASTSDTQVADKTAKMLKYADAKREEMLRFTDKSFDDLRKGDFTVSGIKVKAIEDQDALGRIESRHASEEDKVKYKTYIDEFENATKLKEQLKSGTDLEIIARADDIARKKEEEANGQFLKTASSAAKMVSEELGAVIELLSPFLAKFMGNTQSTAQMIDVLPDIATQGQATAGATVAAPLAEAKATTDAQQPEAPKPVLAAASTTASFGNNDGLPESERPAGVQTVVAAPTAQKDVTVADASPPAPRATAAAEPAANAPSAPEPAAITPSAAPSAPETKSTLNFKLADTYKEQKQNDNLKGFKLHGVQLSGSTDHSEPFSPVPAKNAASATAAKGAGRGE